MKIYEKAVRKPVTTALVFIGVIIFGLFSYNKLAIDYFPEIDAPYVSVFTFYSGASAEDIETNVSRLLEDNLNTVNNLKKISSTSKDNVSMVMMEFEWGTNLDEAVNDVRDAVSLVERDLPDGVEKPTIFRFSTNMMPIMYLTVSANESYSALRKLLDDGVANPLNRIEGVGTVSVSGGPEREIQINLDPQKLEAYNLTIEQLGQVIAQENINIPFGTIDFGSSTYATRVKGEFTRSEALRNLVVSSYQGKDVRLSDVATVVDTIKEMTQEVMTNSRPSALIIIRKQSGANTVNICREVKAQLPALMKTLPPDIRIDVASDSSDSIIKSINSLSDTVFYAAIFVVLVVLFFLGQWRATIIIIVTIPVSLICAFVYLFMTGNTINIISLSSLSIAIGMVVDDAIVVLENISTHLKRGSTPREAAIYATNEVGLAVIATTLTIVAVFLPLTFLSGMAGIMFKQLGWSVTIVSIVSTAAALTLTPMMSSLLLKMESNRKTWSKQLYAPIERFLDRVDGAYGNLLAKCIKHRAWVVTGAALMFLSSLSLLSQVGTEFFPLSDDSKMSATIELPVGVRKENTSEVCRRIEKIVAEKYPEVEIVTATVGAADEDNMFSAMQTNGTNVGTFTFKLKDAVDRERSNYEIADLLRADIAKMPEIEKFQVKAGNAQMGGSQSDFELKIFGHDVDQTTAFAEEMAERMKHIKGAKNIRISRGDKKPEFIMDFDRDKLATYGLNTATVSSMIRNRINGLTCSKFREDGDEYDIVVRYAKPFRESPDAIENIMVYNSQGKGIRVKELGRVVEGYSLPEITRESRQRMLNVSCDVYGDALGNVVKAVQREVEKAGLPDGIYTGIGGTAETQQESFGDLFTLLIMIIALVYIVMASQFESLRMPMIIMISVLFAFTGVFLTLFITGTNLSVIALIGAIMLVGIVVKNGIVLVDFTNLQRERGLSLSQAVITSGKSRLRPVLMTTMTTVLGMIPLALGTGEGSEMWQPMGIAIIGGLTFSTLLTLIVVPVIYSMFGVSHLKRERKRLAELHQTL